MSDPHPLGTYVRRFLLEHVVADRNLSRHTQQSYRDAIRLLLRFLADRYRTEPTRLTVEQVTADSVRGFLAHLEQGRGNSGATRNQRLAALHALLGFIGRQVPELVALAAQVQALPFRRTAPPVMAYLEQAEVDAVLGTPERRRPLGQRDHALLLFLYNTGARADEAARTAVGALQLGAAPAVRILGKGGKTRLCPLWPQTVTVLRALLGVRLDGPPDAPVFRNVRGAPLTRFGIHALVTRTVARAATTAPSLRAKRVSPHTLRHYPGARTIPGGARMGGPSARE